jgi:hypothetical protein
LLLLPLLLLLLLLPLLLLLLPLLWLEVVDLVTLAGGLVAVK